MICVSQTLTLPAIAARRSLKWPAGMLAAVLLMPSLIFLAAFTYWPVIGVLLRSLLQQRFGQSASYGLDNFARLLDDPHFATAVQNTIVYALGTILPSLALALLFALALREQGRLTALLRAVLVMPQLIPLVAASALFVFIFLPGGGLLDYYLAKLGIHATNWLGDPDLALGAIIAITIWKNTGYYMLFFLAGLAGIPEEYHEAAKIDGASAWLRFWRITLPLLGPTIAFVSIIAMVNTLVQIDHVIVMTGGGPSDSTNMILYYIYQQAEQNMDTGLASAATVLCVGSLLAIAVLALRTLERGIHYES
jgi:sn-glycerol 3-phosphate transport system permease protein